MPTLADIFSGIATAKRQAGNFIRQPVSTLQEMIALANDAARQTNQQTALSAQGARQELRGQPMTAEQAAADQDLQQKLINQMQVGGITTIKPTHGSKEIDALLNRFGQKAESLKLPIEYGSSNISGSRYITFKNPEGLDYQIRISNHADHYPNQLAGVGERFSIDPSSGNSYQDAINWLKEKGINLHKRVKKQPEQPKQTFQEKYGITDADLESIRAYKIKHYGED